MGFWVARELSVFVSADMTTPLSGAAQAALKAALEREHGGIKLHVSTVAALATYFAGRGGGCGWMV